MEFRFETDYDQETLTAMARGLRKTVRRKRSRRTHIFAGIVLVIGLASTVLSIASKEPLRARNLLVPLAMLCVIYAVQTPVGKVLLIGSTMTVERERELFGKKVLPNEHR